MKEYQVISIGEAMACRNGEIYCTSPDGMGIGEIMEVMLNRYARDGWDVKEILHFNNGKVLIIFERSCENSEELKKDES